jgi:peptide/nickel transport system substrate-binding protein
MEPREPTGELRELAEGVIAQRVDRREFFRKATVLGLSASAAAAFLAACGSSSSSSSSASSAAASGAAGGTSAPKKGGRLTYGPLGDGGDYDPALNNYDYPSPPFNTIYEGLTGYPAGQNSWNAQNVLADTLEKSTDGKSYQFKLKQGQMFHGGFGEVTANDVKYSMERAASLPGVPMYPGAPKDYVSYYSGDYPNLIGVTVTDKYTGTIQFKEPFAPFETLTLPFATSGYIIPQAAVTKYGKAWTKTPIGTGPYEVASYTPNSEMVLQKFAQYGGAANALGAANEFDEIRMILTPLNAVPKGQALTVALESGQSDFTPNMNALDTQRLSGNSNFKTYNPAAGLNYFFVSVDVQNPKLKDVRVRQAIRYALDINEIIQANRMPLNTRLNSLIGPAMSVGHWDQAPVYNRDLAKAKALLAAAGVSKLSLQITTPSISNIPGQPNAVMQVIQSNLKDVGISVEIVETPPDAYVQKAGFGTLAWTSYGGAPDPYYQFEWFTCSQVGVWNYASWCNQQYSNLEPQLGSTDDTTQRQNIAVQMQQLMDKDVPYIWVSTQVVPCASKANIQAVFDNNANPAMHYFHSV